MRAQENTRKNEVQFRKTRRDSSRLQPLHRHRPSSTKQALAQAYSAMYRAKSGYGRGGGGRCSSRFKQQVWRQQGSSEMKRRTKTQHTSVVDTLGLAHVSAPHWKKKKNRFREKKEERPPETRGPCEDASQPIDNNKPGVRLRAHLNFQVLTLRHVEDAICRSPFRI